MGTLAQRCQRGRASGIFLDAAGDTITEKLASAERITLAVCI